MKTSQVIYGTHPVLEALSSGVNIDRIYIDKTHRGAMVDEILGLCRDAGVVVNMVPVFKLDRITRKNHQGIIAYTALVEYQSVNEIISAAFENGEMPLILLLDGITDVRNFGAIARTAECAGVHAIVIGTKDAAPINEDAIKTSSGALMRIPVCRERNLKRTLQDFTEYGLSVFACSEKGAKSIYEVPLNVPAAIVLGAEDTGISAELLRQCDEIVRIPMAGQTASLNVSVASGIVLFESLRQRNA